MIDLHILVYKYLWRSWLMHYVTSRKIAGSNTSTVTLRVIGGDEDESLKSETVIYGRESQGTRT
jgi:hypothetical protein